LFCCICVLNCIILNNKMVILFYWRSRLLLTVSKFQTIKCKLIKIIFVNHRKYRGSATFLVLGIFYRFGQLAISIKWQYNRWVATILSFPSTIRYGNEKF
jgi:hypothetical protein